VPRRSLKLLSELNETSQRALTVNVYWDDGLVIVKQSIHAAGLTKETLGHACLTVGGAADDIGVLLAAMFGGETPYPALETEDQ
jgi:hypothetical protein